MSGIVKIDNEVFTTENLITLLKLNGRFDSLMEDVLKDKLAVHAAKKQGIALSDDELQERADQFRRAHGLQRAKDTNDYFTTLGVTLEDFEAFISDMLYQEKMLAQVGTDPAVEEYFQLNSPRFDSINISHILMDSEGGAKEMFSVLSDDPESFTDMAREHSVADTAESGGYIGKVTRGSLHGEVEAKVFNAEAGDLLGPFPSGDGSHYEIFRVDEKNPAQLDEDTASEIRRSLRDDWLAGRAREHRIEML
ncbi:MAG: peptidylprolyl isomerase [Pseudomonadales bacterium]